MSIFINQPIINTLGWTLIHSLWQGASIALIAFLLLMALRKAAPQLRYQVISSLLLMMPVLSLITFFSIQDTGTTTHLSGQGFSSPDIESIVLQTVSGEENLKDVVSRYTGLVVNQVGEHVSVITLLWFIGALFFFLRMAGSLLYAQRIRSYGTLAVGTRWEVRVKHLSDRLGIRQKVRIVQSRFTRVPVVIGWLKPMILLPVGILVKLPPDQLEAVLVHELAHIRRNDFLFNIVQSIIEALFFYHPVVWWLSGLLRNEREHVCDDVVLDHFPDKVTYVKALSAMEEMAVDAPGIIPALVKSRSQLFNRIKRVMKTNENNYHNLGGRISAMAIMVLIISLTAGAAIKFSENEKAILENGQPGEIPLIWDNPSTPWISTDAHLPGGMKPEGGIIHIGAVSPAGVFAAGKTGLNPPDTIYKEENRGEERDKERQEAIEAYKEAREAERAAMKELQEVLDEGLEELPEDLDFDFDHDFNFDFNYDFDIPMPDSIDGDAFHRLPGNMRESWHYHPGPDIWVDAFEDFEFRMDSLGGNGYRYLADSNIREQFLEHMEQNQLYWQDYQQQLQENLEDIREYELEARISQELKQQEIERLHSEREDLFEHHYEMPEVPEIPEPYIFKPNRHLDLYFFGSKTEQIMKQELLDDGLIEQGKDYIIELNDKGLIINGEKQSRSAFKKYRRLYESMEGEEMGPDEEFRLVI